MQPDQTWYYFHSTIAQAVAGLIALGAAVVLYRLQQLKQEIDQAIESIHIKTLYDNKYKSFESIDVMAIFEKRLREYKWQELFELVFESSGSMCRSLFGQPTVYTDILMKVNLMAKKRNQQIEIIKTTKFTSIIGISAIAASLIFLHFSRYIFDYGINDLLSGASIILVIIFLYKLYTIITILIDSDVDVNDKTEATMYFEKLNDKEIDDLIKSRSFLSKKSWSELPKVPGR